MKILVLFLLLTNTSNAQLFVGPRSTLYVPRGSILQVDSLMLVPSATLILSNNKIEKSYTAEWAPGAGHTTISQVYTVDTSLIFEGNATIIYSDGGLNGNTANALAVLRAAEISDSLSFVSASSVNIVTHMVNAIFLTPQRIGKFSAGTRVTPLPVSLLSFDAWREGAQVRILWKVASEKEGAFYLVDRSADGAHFSPLLLVPASGNATGDLNYLRYDEQPLSSNNYYRLAVLDKDGQLNYLGTRKVSFQGNPVGLQLSTWPIPAGDDLHLSFSEPPDPDAIITLTDVSGRVLRRTTAYGQQILLSLRGLSAAIYILRYSGRANMLSLRVEKQ